MLVDCGKASKMTKGQMYWLYFELGTPPFNRNEYCSGLGGC